MIWLTWRQFRAAAAMTAGVLAALAAVLAVTGPGLSDDFSTGTSTCITQSGGCAQFIDRFFGNNQASFLAVTAAVLVLPALIGLFWGAPLITRELEAGTHRLVWNQSITRTRWLAVKLGLVGLASMIAAGSASLAVSWWSSPLDTAAAADNFPRMGPLLFGARGIVPIGYAAFAFVLGVTIGMLIRRTLPAMALTLVAFVAVQVAMPLLVRPHYQPPTRSSVQIGEANVDFVGRQGGPGGPLHLAMEARVPVDASAWVLSSRLTDPSGQTVAQDRPLSFTSGPCGPSSEAGDPREGMTACFAELNRLGYRHRLSYQPSSRYWAFQWIETGIFTVVSLGLAGFCFWWIRRRVS